MKNLSWEWGTTQTDFEEDEDNDLICWEEKNFLLIVFRTCPKIGYYNMVYDGVPFKILSFRIVAIHWGKQGFWRWIKSKDDFSEKNVTFRLRK